MGTMSPGWKLWLVALSVAVLGPVISVMASVRLAEDNTRDQLRITCTSIRYSIQAYDETPPLTLAGKNLRQAYIDQYRDFGCPPK